MQVYDNKLLRQELRMVEEGEFYVGLTEGAEKVPALSTSVPQRLKPPCN
jgi:hypothetical protein